MADNPIEARYQAALRPEGASIIQSWPLLCKSGLKKSEIQILSPLPLLVYPIG